VILEIKEGFVWTEAGRPSMEKTTSQSPYKIGILIGLLQ